MLIWGRLRMSELILQVSDVTAGDVPDLPILRDVALTAQAGQITLIIGPNGAGKSTLIKAIAGLIPVSGGKITFDGNDITGIRTDQISERGIAYVPQTDNIFRSLTIRQNLDLALRRAGDATAALARLFEQFPALAD